MAREPQKTRAARAGLSRGLEERRLRRNAQKTALSRLELGEGLRLDSRSRLTTTDAGSQPLSASFEDISPLKDDLNVNPSNNQISAIADPDEADTSYTPEELRDSLVDDVLPEIRENIATLTRRVNLILERLKS